MKITGVTITYRFRAFTLVELIVTIAIIGLIAGLLLPAIASGKRKAQQANCLGNLKQVALAFDLYRGDNNDLFPGPGSKNRYGPRPEDWIWWQYGRGVTNSTIARYVESFQAKLFTCPMDKEARDMQGQGPLPDDPYRYSYALTSYDLMTNGAQVVNHGMASIIERSGEQYGFRHSQIVDPERKMMLVEEDRDTIDDPRWVPHGALTNLVTGRHSHKGNVVFADGHIKTVTPKFGRNVTNSLPTL